MSYAAPTDPTPSRLLRRRGAWQLELTRLVALEGNVLEPRAQRLEGSDAILRQLRRAKDQPGLMHGAAHLMRALRGNEDRAFEVVDGEWVPSSAETARRGESDAELIERLTDLRAQLLLLRSSHQRLRDRVAELEAQLESLADGEAAHPSSLPSVPEARPLEVLHAAAPAVTLLDAGANAPAADHTKQSAAVAPEPAPVNPFRSVAQVLGTSGPGPETSIRLPEPPTVVASIAELMGGDSGLSVSDEPVPESALELAALYAGRFVDDEGTDVGVLLAELKLVAHIGGKLLGLPTTVIDEQARTGILNEQVLQAMSEVVNTLSSTVREISGNPNVRGTPVEPFAAERLHWVGASRQSLALGKTRVGTLWLVAR